MTQAPRRVRALIVDDEPLARRRLRTMLSKHPGVEIVGEAANGTEAIAGVQKLEPDLLLLDIQMPGRDGFDVLRSITDAGHHPVVVFVTAHDEHAVRAFEVQALDYVLKPVTEERVLTAVGRAIARLGERKQSDAGRDVAELLAHINRSRSEGRLPVKTGRGVKLVPLADIHWMEADADLVRIHTTRGTLTMRAKISDVESGVPPDRFPRVHRGAIVNVDWIQEIQPLFKGDYVIVLKNGAQIRTGRAHRAAVQALMRT